MKRLLFVAPSIKYGGAAKNFIGVANYAAQRDHKVFLLTEHGNEPMRFIDPRITQLTTTIDSNSGFFKRWWQAIRAVRKAVKETNADIVISFIELWRSASIIATRFSHAKCIVSERGDPYSRGKKHDKMVFKIFSMAEGHVFQTVQARNFFNKNVRKKSRVIPNPVFKEDILEPYTGEKKKCIVNIARLDLQQKRQDLLISAFSKIAKKYPDHSLLLYGGGNDQEKIQKLIEASECSSQIKIMGITRNVYQAIGESEIMVLSSDFEGIPNAIIEAMCVGVPVISTKCSPGGAQLLIQDGINGLLVERGDADGLSKSMEYLLNNPKKAGQMAHNAFDIKNRFDREVILSKWMDYIETL